MGSRPLAVGGKEAEDLEPDPTADPGGPPGSQSQPVTSE